MFMENLKSPIPDLLLGSGDSRISYIQEEGTDSGFMKLQIFELAIITPLISGRSFLRSPD